MNDPFVLYHIATINKDAEVAHLLLTSLPPLTRYVMNMDLTWQLKNKMVKKIIERDSEYYILPNGKKHGEYKELYLSGQLFRRITYKNGLEDGLFEEWYSNGQLKHQIFYKNGIKEGQHKAWWNTGEISYRAFYKNGMLDGMYESWLEDGQIYRQSFYKDGTIMTLTAAEHATCKGNRKLLQSRL